MKKLYQTILVFVLFGAVSSVYFKTFAVVGNPCSNNPDVSGQNACGTGLNGCDVGERCKATISAAYTCQSDATCSASGCTAAKVGLCNDAGGCPVGPGQFAICTSVGGSYQCAAGPAALSCQYGDVCTIKDGCGSTGGCPFGKRCVDSGSGLRCLLADDPTCTPTGANCDASKASQCGTGGADSCPIGYMCQRKVSGTGPDFQCYTGTGEILGRCGDTTGAGKSCTAAEAAKNGCGPNVGCAQGETCISTALSTGFTFYKCVPGSQCQPADCSTGGCPTGQDCIPIGGSHQCQATQPPKANLGEHETCNNTSECQPQFYCRKSTLSCECGKDNDIVDQMQKCCSGKADPLPNGQFKCRPTTVGCKGGTGVEISCDPSIDTCCDHQVSAGVWEPYTCRLTSGRKADGSPIFTCQKRDIITSCRGTLVAGSRCSDPSGCQCQSGQCVKADNGNMVCLDPKIAIKAGNLNITNIDSFDRLVTLIFGIMVPFALALGVALTAKAGYKIKMSQGNPQEVNAGIEELWHALVGTAVVLLSMVLIRVIIGSLLGSTTI